MSFFFLFVPNNSSGINILRENVPVPSGWKTNTLTFLSTLFTIYVRSTRENKKQFRKTAAWLGIKDIPVQKGVRQCMKSTFLQWGRLTESKLVEGPPVQLFLQLDKEGMTEASKQKVAWLTQFTVKKVQVALLREKWNAFHIQSHRSKSNT